MSSVLIADCGLMTFMELKVIFSELEIEGWVNSAVTEEGEISGVRMNSSVVGEGRMNSAVVDEGEISGVRMNSSVVGEGRMNSAIVDEG